MMMILQTNTALMDALQSDLDRLGTTCRIAVKMRPKSRWERIAGGIQRFEEALKVATERCQDSFEVGISLDHPEYGGIFIWTSKWPDVVNRFDDIG